MRVLKIVSLFFQTSSLDLGERHLMSRCDRGHPIAEDFSERLNLHIV